MHKDMTQLWRKSHKSYYNPPSHPPVEGGNSLCRLVIRSCGRNCLSDDIVYRTYTPDHLLAQSLFLYSQSHFISSIYNAITTYQVLATKVLRKHYIGYDIRRYWVNMACVVFNYCCKCSPCQQRKQLAPVRALLTSVPIIGNPCQMIAVHILEVALSVNNNMYLFVIQDYFTKWTEAIPLHNQIAAAITTELIILLAKFGMPDTLHSDQGRNFESALMKQTLEAFGVHKLRTTAYHPQGDGIIKRFNWLFHQLLRTYVEQEMDWERLLPLVLYAYRTTIHSSMWTSPFVLVFSRHPESPDFNNLTGYDSTSYQNHILSKMAALKDLVEANLVQAASQQWVYYNQHSTTFQCWWLCWIIESDCQQTWP